MKLILTAALSLMAASAAAQEAMQEFENCIWTDHSGRMAQSYEEIGPAACNALCVATEDCSGWYYIPHNFNPDSAPGECGLYAEVADAEPHDREFCGKLEVE